MLTRLLAMSTAAMLLAGSAYSAEHIKARAFYGVAPHGGGSGSQPVDVIVDPSTTMTVSDTNFVVPTITNALLDFGQLEVTDMFDNNLATCGVGGDEHCGNAFFRMYTSGTTGPGFWNATGGYGVPALGGLAGGLQELGLGVENAVEIITLEIGPFQNTLSLSDFVTPPVFNVKGDFTLAGAGSYNTTIVIEYGLRD
jgi:hypothetical protein